MSRRICIIPARAGSKGLPHKNILPFKGRPLLTHSVQQALDSGMFAQVAVSSDSEDYLAIAKQAGASMCILRPQELATDQAGTIDVLLHAVLTAEELVSETFETVTLLQATSPLRHVRHICEAVAKLEHGQLDSVVSVTEAKSSPYFNLLEYDKTRGTFDLCNRSDLLVKRRQDAPTVYQLNGSIYVWSRDALFSQKASLCAKTDIYNMPALFSIDIDNADDWAFAELAADLIARRSAQLDNARQGA